MSYDGASLFQFDFVSATHPDIPPYLLQEMQNNLRTLIAYNPKAQITHSEALMRIPDSGYRPQYWAFHQDTNFPVTIHRTLYGSGLEWLSGELSDEQQYLLAKDYTGFLDVLPEGKTQTVEPGDTILFNSQFIHRGTSKAATEGYMATATSPALPPFFV